MKADQEVTGFSKLRTITIGEIEYPGMRSISNLTRP